MTLYKSPLQSESELQWDQDSFPNQPYNCGPSSVEKVVNYYQDRKTYGIERTRDLGTKRNKTGTNTTEQKRMLDRRGIPSTVMSLSPDQVRVKLRTGHRPLVLWLKMSHIPNSIKGNSFNGNHAVTALANGTVNGEDGIWVNEPNQKRTEPAYKKNRFFADKYWIPASAAIGRWCIVPDKTKTIATRRPLKKKWVVTATVLTIRSGPSTATAKVGTLTKGTQFTSNKIETAGGKYMVDGEIHDNWLGFVRNTKQVWVAKAFVREV